MYIKFRNSRNLVVNFLLIGCVVLITSFSVIEADQLVVKGQLPGREVRSTLINIVGSLQGMFGSLCRMGDTSTLSIPCGDYESPSYAMMDGLHCFLFDVGE